MVKKKVDFYYFIILALILLILGLVFFNHFLKTDSLTGMVTTSGTANLTWSSSAGISLIAETVSFGTGYYNASCTRNYANLNSNITYDTTTRPEPEPYCWINTSYIFRPVTNYSSDYFVIRNTGTAAYVNVSAIADKDGETWLCAGNCPTTNLAGVSLLSYNNETSSCTIGLTTGFEAMTTYNTNVTVGLCDSLDYSDTSDEIRVYVNASIPKDTTSGLKTLAITFEALAV